MTYSSCIKLCTSNRGSSWPGVMAFHAKFGQNSPGIWPGAWVTIASNMLHQCSDLTLSCRLCTYTRRGHRSHNSGAESAAQAGNMIAGTRFQLRLFSRAAARLQAQVRSASAPRPLQHRASRSMRSPHQKIYTSAYQEQAAGQYGGGGGRAACTMFRACGMCVAEVLVPQTLRTDYWDAGLVSARPVPCDWPGQQVWVWQRSCLLGRA